MNVVITGGGVVSAIGGDKRETLKNLRERRSGIGRMRLLRTFHDDLPVGEVRMSDGELREELGIAPDVPMNRTALLGIKALREALEESGLPEGLRLPLISGTTVGGMEKTELYWRDFLTSERHREYIPLQGCGATTALIAEHFGRFSDVMTPSTACSSAANAIIRAADMILAGEAEAVAAGGSECLSSFHHSGFNSLMILDREQCRPFDRTRAGLNLGEGAAYLILESEEHARRRGAKVIARLSGYSNRCDAFHQTASSPDGEGAYLSMTGAIAMAGLSPEDIDYVNAHGTGTPNNDASESAALRRVFGDRMPAVSSTKSFTGHTTSASGSIESVFCLLALTHSFIPVNLGWKESGPDTLVPYTEDGGVRLRNILCNAFGFGGNDSSLIFSRCDEPGDGNRDASGDGNCDASGEGYRDASGDGNCVSGVGGCGECGTVRDRHIYVRSMMAIPSGDSFSDYSAFLSPMEGRRMGKIMKRALATSLTVLREAGAEHPDAIITGTSLGSVADMEPVLNAVCENGGESVKPTNFMQSTHNTLSSLIALKTGTHSCNCTWSQEGLSFENALCDALTQLRTGRTDNALVGAFDELSPAVLEIQRRGGILKDACKAGEVAASFFLEAGGFTGGSADASTLDSGGDSADSPASASGQPEVLDAKTVFIPEEDRQLPELAGVLDRMLSAAELSMDDIDLVLTGRNGCLPGDGVAGQPQVDTRSQAASEFQTVTEFQDASRSQANANDAVYDRLDGLWKNAPQGRWKHIFGEGFSASAAGFHAAATWLLQGFIPAEFMLPGNIPSASESPAVPSASESPAVPSAGGASAGEAAQRRTPRNIIIFNHSAGKHFSLTLLRFDAGRRQ